MAHPRKTIRDALVALIKAAGTSAGTRVYSNRALPVWESELPAILVMRADESAEEYNTAPRELEREFDVDIVIYQQFTEEESLDDLFDADAEIIEAAIAADETLGGVASDTLLTATPGPVINREGDQPVSMSRLTVSVTYYTYWPDPDSPPEPIPALESGGVQWDLGPEPDGQIEAEDELTFEQ